jgi:rare lipoprotein A (peptidoglycan hydrolase)
MERVMQLLRYRPARIPLIAVLAVLGPFAVPASPVQAATGGATASSGVAAEVPIGDEIAFGPTLVAGASWYGPGLYGRQTACGQTLRATTVGVAHRTLPCGTLVKFVYNGRSAIVPVIDRGPFAKGRAWDFTAAASEALEFEGVGKVRYSVALEYARPGTAR